MRRHKGFSSKELEFGGHWTLCIHRLPPPLEPELCTSKQHHTVITKPGGSCVSCAACCQGWSRTKGYSVLRKLPLRSVMDTCFSCPGPSPCHTQSLWPPFRISPWGAAVSPLLPTGRSGTPRLWVLPWLLQTELLTISTAQGMSCHVIPNACEQQVPPYQKHDTDLLTRLTRLALSNHAEVRYPEPKT